MPAPTARPIPRFHPFSGRDVPWLLRTQAATRPDATYLIWEPPEPARSASWTYAEFLADVRRLAAGLMDAGVCQGQFVVLHMENCPQFLLAWHALSWLGAVAVTTNTRSTRDELAYFIGHSGARTIITQSRFVPLIDRGVFDTAVCVAEAGDPVPDRWLDFADLLSRDLPPAEARSPDPLALNSVQYTSGTTSRPKGVVWTHANALWGARINAEHMRLGPDDTQLVFLPLFHTNALAYGALGTLWAGGRIVLLPKFSASRFWELSIRHRVTWASMIRFTLVAIAEQVVPPGHSYRFWGTGQSDMTFVRDRFGVRTLGWWGMSETITHGIYGDVGWSNPPGVMGHVAPEYEIDIRREDGSAVTVGETGRLFIRGVPGLSLFLEYLGDPEATAAAFDEAGWFYTGDRVTCAEGGYVVFADREKDMLKIGAENVAASEIESVIQSLPGVAEVAVVGKPDPMLDEVAVAFVVARSGAAINASAIVESCRAVLADFKVPRQVVLVDEPPRGLLDKVSKKDLRERAKQLS